MSWRWRAPCHSRGAAAEGAGIHTGSLIDGGAALGLALTRAADNDSGTGDERAHLGMARAGSTPSTWPVPQMPLRTPFDRVRATSCGGGSSHWLMTTSAAARGSAEVSTSSSSQLLALWAHSRASWNPVAPMIAIETPTATSMYFETASILSAPRRAKPSAPTRAAPTP